MTARTGRQEWRAHWPLVLSAMAGISFCGVPAASLGLFMAPLNSDFGWSSTQVAAGMTVFSLVSLVLTPFAGALVDRVGSRRVAIPGLALTGLAFAAFGLMTGPYAQWLGLWFCLSLAMLLIRMMTWNRAVSSAFTTARGLAVAVLLMGFSLTQAVVPPLTHFLLEQVGWRGTYAILGLGWAGIGLILVLLFFREPGEARHAAASAAPREPLGGLTVHEALRNPPVIKIAFATVVMSIMGTAVAIHFVPLLVSSGLERGTAAGLAALVGIFSMVGKLLNGWLIDRFSSRFIPFSAFALPALAYFLLWQGKGSVALLALAAAVIGYAGGASLQMSNYLATRYAGLANFGKIFGIISSLMGVAAGVSPMLAGMIFDRSGNYDLLLFIGMPLALAAGFMVSTLGPYPRFERGEAARP